MTTAQQRLLASQLLANDMENTQELVESIKKLMGRPAVTKPVLVKWTRPVASESGLILTSAEVGVSSSVLPEDRDHIFSSLSLSVPSAQSDVPDYEFSVSAGSYAKPLYTSKECKDRMRQNLNFVKKQISQNRDIANRQAVMKSVNSIIKAFI